MIGSLLTFRKFTGISDVTSGRNTVLIVDPTLPGLKGMDVFGLELMNTNNTLVFVKLYDSVKYVDPANGTITYFQPILGDTTGNSTNNNVPSVPIKTYIVGSNSQLILNLDTNGEPLFRIEDRLWLGITTSSADNSTTNTATNNVLVQMRYKIF